MAKKNNGIVIVFILIIALGAYMMLSGNHFGMFTSSTTEYTCQAIGTSLTGCGIQTFSSLSSCNAAVLQCNNHGGFACKNHCTSAQVNCAPNWQCNSWSACSNSLQNRTCVDKNNCEGTNNINVLPTLQTQNCKMPDSGTDYTWYILAGVGIGLVVLFFMIKK